MTCANTSPRLVATLNRDWTFHYDPVAEANEAFAQPGFDDARWTAVAMPHTWSTYETTGDVHPFIRDASESDNPYWWHGWGWYRKRFTLDACIQGRRIFLEFDGVQKFCRVWVNGVCVGEHAGGFTSFSVDISQAVHFGTENVVAVQVSNRRDDPRRIPPMTAGNWNVYGGIYRDVRLVATHPIYIPFQGNWEHDGGTFVTTPFVTKQAARVHVRTHVHNAGATATTCRLQTTIVDSDGTPVAVMESEADVPAAGRHGFDQNSEEILHPALWAPEQPSLYTVNTVLLAGGTTVDSWRSPLGFRWFHWDYETRRLYLNNCEVHLHGTNRHQEYPWLGDAVPKWVHVDDLQDIRFNLNHNFMRTCHYPQDPLVYRLCDRYGILCCEEVPNIKALDFADEIQRRNVVEMVRRDRNHPSIIMWSMGNETNHAADGGWARAEDDTRIIHFRKCEGRGEDEPHNSAQLDMENLLRCTLRGWHDEDVGALPPDQRIPCSDNGQVTGTEESQHRLACVQDGSIRGRIDENIVVWLYADHGADRTYRYCPLKYVNPKGWVDAYRQPKYMYHLWRANHADEPMVFIHPHAWRREYLGQQHDIVVDSNCDRVELQVNEEPIGHATPGPQNFQTVTFHDVLVCEGCLEAIATRDGKTVTHRLPLPGPPASLDLSSNRPRIPADRSGIALLKAELVDARGTPVPGAANELHWRLEGPGRLLGPAVWTSDTDKRLSEEGTLYIEAPVVMPLRATCEAGLIQVEVSSPGLDPARLTIEAADRSSTSPEWLYTPVLTDAGRAPRQAARAGDTRSDAAPGPGMIPTVFEDIPVQPGTHDAYRAQIDAFIRRRAPNIDLNTPAYNALLNGLADTLVHRGGPLIADDFNFAVRRYNEQATAKPIGSAQT